MIGRGPGLDCMASIRETETGERPRTTTTTKGSKSQRGDGGERGEHYAKTLAYKPMNTEKNKLTFLTRRSLRNVPKHV